MNEFNLANVSHVMVLFSWEEDLYWNHFMGPNGVIVRVFVWEGRRMRELEKVQMSIPRSVC